MLLLIDFFAFHFILPFILVVIAVIHLLFLHQTGSNNPLGIKCDQDRVPFHLYYSVKDVLGYIIALLIFIRVILFIPNYLTDPENFLLANPLVTPVHIKPEWYFLWVYAILRSIPNKLGGVVALFMAIIILFILPYSSNMRKIGMIFYPLNQVLFWGLVVSWAVLTWIGGRPVEDPYIFIGQRFTFLYFMFYILNPVISAIWDDLLII